jgi:GNAT superfamily N-acetyltransferase
MRGKGFGRVMLSYLAKLAKDRNYGRFEWVVLDWNTPAIEFYKSLGAEIKNEWLINRLTGKALENLASEY